MFMDEVVRELQARVANVGVEISTDDNECKLNIVMFTDDTVLIPDT